MRYLSVSLLIWFILVTTVWSDEVSDNKNIPFSADQLILTSPRGNTEKVWITQIYLPHLTASINDDGKLVDDTIQPDNSYPVWLEARVGSATSEVGDQHTGLISLFHDKGYHLNQIAARMREVPPDWSGNEKTSWPPKITEWPDPRMINNEWIKQLNSESPNNIKAANEICRNFEATSAALLQRLTAWCTLYQSRGDWLKLPWPSKNVEQNSWLLFRNNDFSTGQPITAFLVHDAVVLKEIVGDQFPETKKIIPVRDKNKEFHIVDFGHPLALAKQRFQINDKQPSVVFNLRGIQDADKNIIPFSFPSDEALIFYPKKDSAQPNDVILNLTFRNNFERGALHYCGNLTDDSAVDCDRQPFTGEGNPVSIFLEALLPDALGNYKVISLQDSLYARMKSLAWGTSGYHQVLHENEKRGQLTRTLMTGEQSCAYLTLNENTSLARLFSNKPEISADGDCQTEQVLALSLRSEKRDYCIGKAEDAKVISLNSGVSAMSAFKARGLSQPFVYLKTDNGERFIAAAETNLRDWANFLSGTAGEGGNTGQVCRDLLTSTDLAPWLSIVDGVQEGDCHRTTVKPEARGGLEIDPEPDPKTTNPERRVQYDAFRYFYHAVKASTLKLFDEQKDSLEFVDYLKQCHSGNRWDDTNGDRKKLCELRTFMVLKSLNTYQQLTGKTSFVIAKEKAALLEEAGESPVASCGDSAGAFNPNPTAKKLCFDLKSYWQAAMTAGTDPEKGFWQHPVVMVTVKDARDFIEELRTRRNESCAVDTFALPELKDLQAASRSREGSSNFDTLFEGPALDTVPLQMRFRLRAGLPGVGQDKVPTGGHSIYGALTGVREWYAKTATETETEAKTGEAYGFDAAAWREKGDIFGRNYHWGVVPKTKGSNGTIADPMTGFRLIFEPEKGKNR